MVDGRKVPNDYEQGLIAVMRDRRAAGESLLSIHRWLTDKNVRLAYSSMRHALLNKKII